LFLSLHSASSCLFPFSLFYRRPPSPPLFPSTTLFRSGPSPTAEAGRGVFIGGLPPLVAGLRRWWPASPAGSDVIGSLRTGRLVRGACGSCGLALAAQLGTLPSRPAAAQASRTGPRITARCNGVS